MKFVPSIRLHTLACLLITAAWWPAQAQSLQYIGQQIVPSGTQFQGTTVGGLSGIDFVASSGRYVAISDDRSSFNPARYYELTLDLARFVRSANPGQAGVGFQSVTTILDSNGQPFASNTLDPEGIRYNAAAGTLVWSNEGQRAAAGLQNPTVREMTLAGGALRDFAVPTTFNPVGSVAGTAPGDGGIRNNLAFESLTFSTDGRMLYTATENALVQDGAAAALGVGSPSRIVSFDTTTGAAGAQWVYTVEPVVLPPNPAGGFATNGLVELLALGDRQFIAVERSFAVGAATPGVGPNGLPTGNTIRLYFVDASNATDVSGLPSLAGASYTPAAKTLLLDLSTLTHDDGTPLALDNIEGITWGPEYNGKPTLVLVSDNNFGATQFTQFVALSVTSPIPEPGSWALLASGLGVLLMRLRRR
jgi:hypothetical protein